mgnify:CR=1 FL=1
MPNTDKHRKHQATASRINLVSLFAFAAIIGLSLMYYMERLPLTVAVYLLAISSTTFIAYAIDKRAAQKQNWRVKESKLQLLALLGGWPGALLAQQLLRHKSAKGRFKLVLWLGIMLNIALSLLLYQYLPSA